MESDKFHTQARLGPLLTADIAAVVASFLPSLTDFFRLWLTCKSFQRSFPPHSSNFWDMLLRLFLSSRNISHEEATRSFFVLPKQLTLAAVPRINSNAMAQQEQDLTKNFHAIALLFTPRKCSRSGCYRMFFEWQNNTEACTHHTGKLRAMNGNKKQQYLSCCRGNGFDSPGCKTSYHNGMFHMLTFSKRPPVEEQSQEGPQPNSSSLLPSLSDSSKKIPNATLPTSRNTSISSVPSLPAI